MRNTRVRAIADTAVSAALCALLIIISVFVPPFALFAAAASGTPIMFASCKWGGGYGFAAVLCAAAAVLLLSGDLVSTLLIMVTFGMPSVVFGFAVKHKADFPYAVVAATAFVIMGLVGQMILINGDGDGIRNILTTVISETEQSMEDILVQSGMENTVGIMGEISKAMDMLIEAVITYMPSFIIICAAAYGYGLSMLGVFFMKRLKTGDVAYTKFSMIHTPKVLCIGLLIALGLNLSDGGGMIYGAFENVAAISIAAIACCGLSYIDYNLSKFVTSGYARAFIYVAALVMGFMFISFIFGMLTVIGVADAIFNFRARRQNRGDGFEK